MPETVEDLTPVQKLRASRDELLNGTITLVEARKAERTTFEARLAGDDKPSDEDRSAFTAAEEAHAAEFTRREQDIKDLNQRIAEEDLEEQRRKNAADASRHSPTVEVRSEPLTYREDNQVEISYFRDLAARYHGTYASRVDDLSGAHERLERHAKEIDVEMPKREQGREARAQLAIDRAERDFTGSFTTGHARGLGESPFERRVNPNRTDGQGGYFVPPIWLIDDYIPALRAGRVAAGLCRQMDLPEGTDSINIPKLSTATLTGVQSADAAAVTSQDFTDTSVSAGVKTIAGQEDVSLQLLEQSPGQIIDRVVMEDLLADYNMQIDRQVLLGTNANGQVNGLLPISNWSGGNTVTWTTSTPLGQSYNQAVGAAVSKLSYNRYNLENVHVLQHPRRWFWFATAVDGASGTSGRPLVNVESVALNVSAVENDPAPSEGRVGHFPFGPNAYIDGNLPIVASAAGAITTGSNDLALAGKWDDAWLFEGSLRTRVLPEILSGTLQIRYQAFNYFTLLVRYGASFAVILGTGMAAPTGSYDSSITF